MNQTHKSIIILLLVGARGRGRRARGLEGEYLGEDLEDNNSSSCWRFREGKEEEESQPPPPWTERGGGREGEVREKGAGVGLGRFC
jgi:hypothetical protein